MATCLVVTDAGLDGVFAMALMSKAELFEKSCRGELHIAVAMPDNVKLDFLKEVLRHQSVKIYKGMTFKATKNHLFMPRTETDKYEDTEASKAIEDLLNGSNDIKILVIGPGTDLAHAINKFSATKKKGKPNNIKEIVWAAGHDLKDEDVEMSRNLYLDVQAVEDILAHESLRGKIKMVSLNHKSAYYSDITTDNFKELYQTLHNFNKDHPMKFVADMSAMYVDDREESTSSLQQLKHHLRAGNIVAALVMFHPKLIKAKLYQTLHNFNKDHPMKFVAQMSAMYVDDREESTSSLQQLKHQLRAGNIVAALVMFHPKLIKASESSLWAMENVSPSNDGTLSCLTNMFKVMATNENPKTEDLEIEKSFKLETITEINEVNNAEGSSNTLYFEQLVLQLLSNQN
ncbi:hypothetical protein ABG067_000006 [Albugo candida]